MAETIVPPMLESDIQTMIAHGWEESAARECAEGFNRFYVNDHKWGPMARGLYLNLVPKKKEKEGL